MCKNDVRETGDKLKSTEMITELPKKIRFLSDGNEAEFVEICFFEKKKTTEKIGKYIYTKSVTKKGMEVTLSLEQINKILDDKLLKILK